MLKRISVSQLRIGMYIHELCGSWLDHSFWRSRFLIEQDSHLSRLQGSKLEWVWIDTDRGLDVETVAAQVAAGSTSDRSGTRAQTLVPVVDDPARKASERAQGVRDASGDLVAQMFSDAQLGRRLDVKQIERLARDVADSIDEHPDALLSLARIKRADQYTYMHSVAVAALMTSLARELGLPAEQVRLAGMAGLLHDIGKVGIPEKILNKAGRLTDEEFEIVKRHPAEGAAILRREEPEIPPEIVDVCLHHHERMDGRGYPDGLAGGQISLLARMGAICDVYDAITSNRPYKKGWDPAFSLGKMAEWEGHFDAEILAAFTRALGRYPVGSILSLTSGELAVVVAQNRDVPDAPVVKVFYSNRLCQYTAGRRIDLADPDCGCRIVPAVKPVDWAQSGLSLPSFID
ncbi:HD-GYP domain-containing protein [Castellaniella sp. GW247-6E4]|uniref:HD-GYP domain-containing protein n=1 Tax=Castellaniella sp. GW247-6E4 TaxID=3140380 RepID=UPI003315B85B